MDIFFCVSNIVPAPAAGVILCYVDSFGYENQFNHEAQFIMYTALEENDNANQINSKIKSQAIELFEIMFSREITPADEIFMCGDAFR
jgi:hypothetical protein